MSTFRRASRPSSRATRRSWALLAALLAAPACVEPVTVEPPPPRTEVEVGEERGVVLQFMRFDVEDFAQTLTMSDLAALPRPLLEETWLLDLPLPPFIDNALVQFMNTPEEEALELPRPTRNLWRLLNMTPVNAGLEGTELAPLIAVGAAVGIPPALILANLVQADENERIIPLEITTQAVLQDLVATHPNAQYRPGPITPENPSGLYPVTPGTLPVTLADVAYDFTTLAERFGPAPMDPLHPGVPTHPGFIKSASGLSTSDGEFTMTVRVSLNALPYRGIDLTYASEASVNSTPSQAKRLIDTSDPSWLTIQGLAADVAIENLTMVIYENPAFVPGGNSKAPVGQGDSPVWGIPPWQFERIIADAARLRAQEINDHCNAYGPLGLVDPPFEPVSVCIDATGWTDISVDPSVVLPSPAPAPSYFWDILMEVAETRLHDGGVPEGDATMEIALHDVPVGLTSEELVTSIRQNLEKSPEALANIAAQLNQNSFGQADFYYYMPYQEEPREDLGDYLFFIAPGDIPLDAGGNPSREYGYAHPGFYADAALTRKVSSTAAVDGDVTHEKVKIEPGTVLYVEDDQGQIYRLRVGPKPSPHRVALSIQRVDGVEQ